MVDLETQLARVLGGETPKEEWDPLVFSVWALRVVLKDALLPPSDDCPSAEARLSVARSAYDRATSRGQDRARALRDVGHLQEA